MASRDSGVFDMQIKLLTIGDSGTSLIENLLHSFRFDYGCIFCQELGKHVFSCVTPVMHFLQLQYTPLELISK
jgi:hypothetical protein